jgi:hypothetical protein
MKNEARVDVKEVNLECFLKFHIFIIGMKDYNKKWIKIINY